MKEKTDIQMEIPEGWEPDDQQIRQNLMEACESAFRKRENYKRYGPMFVLISGIIYLALIFGLDSKIEFLILWVVTDFYTAALMIRAEYKLHKYRELLGMTDTDEGSEGDPEGDMSETETEGQGI